MPKGDGLTVKERKAIRGLAQGKTGEQAGIAAGYPPKAARSQVSRLMTKVNSRETFLKALEKAGLDDDSLAEAIKSNLEGKNQKVTPKGEAVDFKDGDLKDKAVTQLARMRGLYAPKDVNVEVGGLNELLANLVDDDD